MNRILLSLITTALVGFSSPALANPSDEEMAQKKAYIEEMRALKHQEMQARHKQRLLHIKEKLNLNESQLAAWEAYEASQLARAGHKGAMLKELKAKHAATGEPPNSMELAEANVERLTHQLEEAKANLRIYSDLYYSLDEEQKKVMDGLARKHVREKAKDIMVKRRAEEREQQRKLRKVKPID